MKALVLEELIGPRGVLLRDLDAPEPDGTRVIIDVTATGASFPELLTTYGRYQDRLELPFIPGVEAYGTVVDAPSDSALEVGDAVVAATFSGGWAERIAVQAEFVAKAPRGLTPSEAVATVMNYHTAYVCMVVRGRLKAGETVVIPGAAGGLGSAAIQIANGIGARPVALVSTVEKAEVARRAGAADVVVATGDWAGQVRALTDGVDVVFDVVGANVLDHLRLLRREGRFIVAGFAGGHIPSVKINHLLLKNIDLVGAAWGDLVKQDPRMFRATAGRLEAMVASGVIAPVIHGTYPVTEVQSALEQLETRAATGKVVLEF